MSVMRDEQKVLESPRNIQVGKHMTACPFLQAEPWLMIGRAYLGGVIGGNTPSRLPEKGNQARRAQTLTTARAKSLQTSPTIYPATHKAIAISAIHQPLR